VRATATAGLAWMTPAVRDGLTSAEASARAQARPMNSGAGNSRA